MSHPPRSVARIDLEQARKQAKELLAAFRAADRRALETVRWNHPRFRKLKPAAFLAQEFKLADAQLVVARTHHIESWTKLKAHVEAMERGDPAVSTFERAAELVISGDTAALRALLREHSSLVTQRSSRAHHSTILHYVSANGVEDYRQVTPANIVEITQVLLDAGADVNATSEAYGGGSTTLGLVATSAHPRLAGVQIALMDLLIDRGATFGEIRPQNPVVRYSLANGCPEAAVHLVQRGAKADTVYGAAGLGDRASAERLIGAATQDECAAAIVLAAQCEHADVVRWLMERGVPLRAHDGMTALHWAAANGDVLLVNDIVARGGDLEALNEFGGTVLSSTVWFAGHAFIEDFGRRNYPAMFDRLIALGARVDFYPALADEIAKVLKRSVS